MNLKVPSLYPGERSLPAELRTPRGVGNFAQMRLRASLQPSASPTFRNQMRLRGMGWLGGLGQGDSSDGWIETEYDGTGSGEGGIEGSDLPTGTIITSGQDVSSPSAVQDYFNTFGFSPTDASSYGSSVAPYVASPPNYTGPTVVSASSSTPSAPTGYQWAQLINSQGNTLAKVLTLAQGGSSVTLPNGTQLLYGSGASTAAGASGLLGGLSTITGINSNTLLLVGAGVLVFMLLESRK